MHDSLFQEIENEPRESEGWYTAHCDGGSRGNPGPSGYGAVIEDPSGKVAAKLSDYLGRQTNNYAEYKGLISILIWAREHGARRVRVVSDSELMVKQMKGQYKVASPGLRPLWEEATRLAGQLERFEMRHTLRGGNKEADQLANDAMDRGMGRQPVASGAAVGSEPFVPVPKAPVSTAPALNLPKRAMEGYVKGGVVHLLEGELPDGTFVNVIPK